MVCFRCQCGRQLIIGLLSIFTTHPLHGIIKLQPQFFIRFIFIKFLCIYTIYSCYVSGNIFFPVFFSQRIRTHVFFLSELTDYPSPALPLLILTYREHILKPLSRKSEPVNQKIPQKITWKCFPALYIIQNLHRANTPDQCFRIDFILISDTLYKITEIIIFIFHHPVPSSYVYYNILFHLLQCYSSPQTIQMLRSKHVL